MLQGLTQLDKIEKFSHKSLSAHGLQLDCQHDLVNYCTMTHCFSLLNARNYGELHQCQF
jgi:hypothetical protein